MTTLIHIIDLTSYVFDCAICEEHYEIPASSPSYGVARYEDVVVPDSYKGEWGGAPDCHSEATKRMQREKKARSL